MTERKQGWSREFEDSIKPPMRKPIVTFTSICSLRNQPMTSVGAMEFARERY
jgi:hypothetical protein